MGMNRVAVFVDAGYLFAQGSTAISDGKKARSVLSLDPAAVIERLRVLALEKAPSCTLLRIYWYDGLTASGRPTNDQSLLAESNDVKLRLGLINRHGQQKGVDSLIVTDLIELARQKSISDALLLSGDEDIRIGVQIAQTFGVRVHLLGLHPSRGSQSRLLMQEADTTTEWMPETISGFLSILSKLSGGTDLASEKEQAPAHRAVRQISKGQAVPADAPGSIFAEPARSLASELTELELQGITAFWQTDRGVPPDLDKRLLRSAREAAGRVLDTEELKSLRAHFRKAVKERLETESQQAENPGEPNA
jgi:uncharacterized LabA/DUF88 family protein